MVPVRPFYAERWPDWQRQFPSLSRLVLARLDTGAGGGEEERWLSGREQRQLAGFALEKRRREWLAGRKAAKWAVARFWGDQERDWRKIEIVAGADGHPLVVAPDGPLPPFLSISHSGECAGAMAADLPCGLDVQQGSKKILLVRKRFVVAAEEDLLWRGLPPTMGEEQALTLLWAAKEAVRKMAWPPPLPFFSEIRLVAVAGEGEAALFSFALARTADPVSGPWIRVQGLLLENGTAWAFGCRPVHRKGNNG